MKRKTTMSLIIALLMILSTLVITTPSGASEISPLCVEKQVSNGEGWYDSINAVYGDIVQFKITISYYGDDCVDNIVASDTLPPGLEYTENTEPEDVNPTISGNVIVWDLGDTYLETGWSTDIIFKAKVVGVGENVNTVNVTAIECCPDQDVFGVDTATVIVDPSVYVEKKVWDSDTNSWVDELGWVIKGQKVRFQITITYHGTDLMKCMVVDDYIGYCPYGSLDYADNVKFTYPSTQFDDPEVTISEDLKYVKFDWTKSLFNLYNGESIVIEFDTNVTKYCNDYSVTNHAYVDIWSCECCTHLYGYDYATVYCKPHPPVFNKKVYDGEEYVEKANVYVNDTIKYKISLTYYGTDNLTCIKITDEIPCVLEHLGGNATLTVLSGNEAYIGIIKSDISANKKTACWNLTDELEDGGTLSIVFNVLVTGATGDCEECGINTASYTAYSEGTDYSGSDTAKIYSTYRPPVPPNKIDITVKRISLGRIHGAILNLGDQDLNNVKYTISVNGGILKRIKLDSNGTFEEIDASSSASISTAKRSIKHAFGRITVTITVVVGDETYEENFKGFVLGRIIRLKPAA